ncbi:MAG: hypothetical protein IJ408_04230 [Clostridia bacterium]|nr:hypothetical protein [Clostridia bacterium]
MKKYLIYSTIVIVAIIVINIVLENVLILPIMYKNSSLLDKESNYQIKSLVIDAIKDRCSSLYNIDSENIYSNETKEIIQYEFSKKNKSPVCFFDRNFMETLVISENSKYQLVVKMNYPEQYIYNFIITKKDDRFLIEFFQLDI